MPLTLGLTGMDPATETALKAAFIHANTRIGNLWQLVPETEAEHVMVDMDSMYGPMSWLRLHAAGKRVIGLTTAPRTQTDFRLGRPFDSDSFSALLRDVAVQDGVSVPEPPAETTPVAAPAPAAVETAPAAARAAAPAAAIPVAVAPVQSATDAPAIAPREPEPVAAAEPVPEPAAPDTPAVAEPTQQASTPREQRLGDWLAPGLLDRRVRYRNAGIALLIDPASRSYHGPVALKSLAASVADTVRREDFEEVDAADWARESAAAGDAQPLQRLQWLGALLAGQGSLLPGHDPDGRYRLNKWPQTEREYPKHFRIATAMMKGPATLPEIAEASGMPVADVADFVNASLATGFADLVPDAPAEPVEAVKPGGLFGRLRGK
ncbi:MAG: hypothetical protein L0H23_10115 [Luteimonas sp.]|nr:hypothetical protein [Luteimonas sp.]